MSDMLVKLYDLPPLDMSHMKQGVFIRRALAPEKRQVCRWIENTFHEQWASEAEIAFVRQPIAIYLAIENAKIIGFSCYDATCLGFFGPIGVKETNRNQGVGGALLVNCLYGMREAGYGYGIIGDAGGKSYFQKKVGAITIEDSIPGIYVGLLAEED